MGDVDDQLLRTSSTKEVGLKAEHRELLRRLTLNDERALKVVMTGRVRGADALLEAKARALVRLAGLVALDSETASLQAAIDTAHGAGALDEEILETAIAIAPIVGLSRISSALPRLATALDQS